MKKTTQEELAFAIEAVGEVPCMSAPDIYFIDIDNRETYANTKMAIKLCQECPVKNICLNYAIDAQEMYGVWGGLSPHQRKELTRNRINGLAA